MTVEIIIGDALTELRKLPSDSVDCCVTSPPYWGLRDYGVAGQLGMETSLGEHLAVMVEIFEAERDGKIDHQERARLKQRCASLNAKLDAVTA